MLFKKKDTLFIETISDFLFNEIRQSYFSINYHTNLSPNESTYISSKSSLSDIKSLIEKILKQYNYDLLNVCTIIDEIRVYIYLKRIDGIFWNNLILDFKNVQSINHFFLNLHSFCLIKKQAEVTFFFEADDFHLTIDTTYFRNFNEEELYKIWSMDITFWQKKYNVLDFFYFKIIDFFKEGNVDNYNFPQNTLKIFHDKIKLTTHDK